jgi:hypothetical protein
VSPAERDLMRSVIRSALLLAAVLTVPVALLALAFGPVLALAGFAAAIPLCAQLGGAVRLGADMEAALARATSDPGLLIRSTLLATFFGINVFYAIPEPIGAVPLLSILLTCQFAIALYTLGMRCAPDRFVPDVLAPVLVLALLSFQMAPVAE